MLPSIQLGLPFTIAPAPRPVCGRCGLTRRGVRCRICDKGEIPAPGSATWKRWVHGLLRTVRARLTAVGLEPLAWPTSKALLYGQDLPPSAQALLADIAILPVSHDAYQRLVDRGVARALATDQIMSLGIPAAEAYELAGIYAEEVTERRRVGKRRVAPTQVRVDATVEPSGDEAAVAAEHEAVTGEAHAARARLVSP